MPTKIEIDKKLLTELYSVKQLSAGKISQRLGYSQTCIYNNLKRWQIPIISNSQRYKGKPGRPHTKEARKKLALSKMGDKNPMKRLEVRLKVSKKNKGRKYSNDIRARMSKAQKGRTITWGDKLSAANKKWYTSVEGQEFIRQLKQRTGFKNPMYGKSEQIQKRHWSKIWDSNRKKNLISKFREARMKQKFSLKSTKIEIMVAEELVKRKIAFLKHYPVLNICQPDIVIPKYKVVVQCDGDWWHGNPNIYNQSNLAKIPQNNMRRDNLKDFQLHEEGWHVIRFWESDIKDNVAHCVDKVENFIKKKQGV